MIDRDRFAPNNTNKTSQGNRYHKSDRASLPAALNKTQKVLKLYYDHISNTRTSNDTVGRAF
jgi:hypothetical protein